MYLVFDTETTGKWDFKKSATLDEQPHLVQLAAGLYTKQHTQVAQMNVIVFPFDWEIPQQVSELHGITHQMALDKGVGLTTALRVFQHLILLADTVVAQNIQFDLNIINRQVCFASNLGKKFDRLGSIVKGLTDKQLRCTMKAAIPIVKVLHAKPRHDKDYKYPTLTETYKHFFQQEFSGAHDAMNDVVACSKVYAKLCEHYTMQPCVH